MGGGGGGRVERGLSFIRPPKKKKRKGNHLKFETHLDDLVPTSRNDDRVHWVRRESNT